MRLRSKGPPARQQDCTPQVRVNRAISARAILEGREQLKEETAGVAMV